MVTPNKHQSEPLPPHRCLFTHGRTRDVETLHPLSLFIHSSAARGGSGSVLAQSHQLRFSWAFYRSGQRMSEKRGLGRRWAAKRGATRRPREIFGYTHESFIFFRLSPSLAPSVSVSRGSLREIRRKFLHGEIKGREGGRVNILKRRRKHSSDPSATHLPTSLTPALAAHLQYSLPGS